jgi:hypothetical protein
MSDNLIFTTRVLTSNDVKMLLHIWRRNMPKSVLALSRHYYVNHVCQVERESA